MTSRTPIRLTPHRGPLAMPSTSPESSPTLSTPPTDIFHCSTTIAQALDTAILQHRISSMSPPARHQSRSRLYRRKREVTKQGLFGRSAHPFSFIFENLVYSAYDLAKSLAGIVTFCFLIWGLLEWVIIHLWNWMGQLNDILEHPVLVCIWTTSTTESLGINTTISLSIPHESSALPREPFTMSQTKRSACCRFTVSF